MAEVEKLVIKEASEDILMILKVFDFFCKPFGLQKLKIHKKTIAPVGNIYKIYSCFVTVVLCIGMIYIILAMCIFDDFNSLVIKSTISITHIWIFLIYIKISISSIFFLPKKFMKIFNHISIADTIISMRCLKFDILVRSRVIKIFSIHVTQKILQIIMDLYMWMTNYFYFSCHLVLIIIDFEFTNFAFLVSIVTRRIEKLNFLMVNSVEAENSKSFFKINQGLISKSWKLKYRKSDIKSNQGIQGFVEAYRNLMSAINIIQDSYKIHVS